MRWPEPTIREGLFYTLIACWFLMVIAHGASGSRLPASPDFKVASR